MVLIVVVGGSTIFSGDAIYARIQTHKELIKVIGDRDYALEQNVQLWRNVEALQGDVKEKEELLVAKQLPVIYRDVCSISTFKSWMDSLKISDHSSLQWKLQKSATTEKNFGFRWIDQKYILVAMAKEYGPVGSKYLITFESGQSINVMIGDVKQEPCNSPDGSIIEFIIDSTVTPKSIIRSGNFNDIFKGSIIAIMVIE